MKKSILVFLITLTGLLASAQKSEVIIDSLDSKSVIFSKTLVWIAKNWQNANEVIQLKDENIGTIIVKGNLRTSNRNRDISKTEITFNIKDGKAKITFENTILWNPGFIRTFENPTKWYEKWRDDVSLEIDSLIIDYKKSLLKMDEF
jgi:hypothetical protein